MIPKYAILEIERKWVADLDAVGSLEGIAYTEIEDLYVQDTRMRLRKMVSPDSGPDFKLCKKYGKKSVLSEPITNLYLTEAEYTLLERLPGIRVRKRRYKMSGGSLDVFMDSEPVYGVFELEFGSEQEAEQFVKPHYARREITGEPPPFLTK